ncbi:PEP-CTERM system histidine kinase PrsK [Aliiglaciecola sp. CAU 1673]|uniref:XrtA/PEP-CTERM system histidine kinase PrsK n=1 Tax=Aliiglaciecola sp. CAU 1673 TaxID=3032595 RepID=UPI0023DA87A1|nr:XrtA/PEP-CTERM system histidine kinase PrsK [Aliiglaciecola sp. CAU 1673]MDF2177329.1 PEP-CTERM system histidine kinase PrsK [Aliiglaciecola sp. CAU 1673]
MLAEIGYFLGIVGNLLLVLLLLTVRKPGLAKRLLILATFFNAVWAGAHLSHALYAFPVHSLLAFEAGKSLLWLLFLCSVIKKQQLGIGELLSRPITLITISLPIILIASVMSGVLGDKWLYLLMTIISLELLVLLETLYRQAGEERWHYKPLAIYLGATGLFDFVMFADASMLNQLDPMFWAARGYVHAMMLPALVVAIRRIKHWGIEIFISRDVVLHSSLLIVAGGYLCVMALAGYAIRYIGGNWSGPVQIALAFLSLILLATVFLSNSFRSKLKVFITKHFFANQYDYREEWLKLSQALNTEADSLPMVYQNGLNSLLRAIGYQSGMLLKSKNSKQEVVCQQGHPTLTQTESSVVDAIAAYVQDNHWLVDIEELRCKPFQYEGLRINHGILNECSFQLVVPIFRENRLWGMALLQPKSDHRVHLNWELRDYLNAVTAQVANYIFHYEAAKELAENAQFAAFNRMSAFVLHDLKNVLAQIDLILCNAPQHKHNPAFIEDTFETLQHTKARMEKMLKQLTEKKANQPSQLRAVSMAELISKVVKERCQMLSPRPVVEELSSVQVSLDEEKFSNVVYHLISNAQQATDDAGKVIIRVGMAQEPGVVLIEIEDNGCGMSQEFIANRLFKPFDTTKGNAGMGIGAYDAKSYVEQSGGRVEVNSKVGEGTVFRLYLPVINEKAA